MQIAQLKSELPKGMKATQTSWLLGEFTYSELTPTTNKSSIAFQAIQLTKQTSQFNLTTDSDNTYICSTSTKRSSQEPYQFLHDALALHRDDRRGRNLQTRVSHWTESKSHIPAKCINNQIQFAHTQACKRCIRLTHKCKIQAWWCWCFCCISCCSSILRRS